MYSLVLHHSLTWRLLVGVRSVRVLGAGESAAARVADRELPLSGVAGGVRRWSVFGRLASHVCVWHLAGHCAMGLGMALLQRLKSLDVLLVARVPRPMPDGYGQIPNPLKFALYSLLRICVGI